MRKHLATFDTQADAETCRRRMLAERTRPQWCRSFNGSPRLFEDSGRRLPFVKDVIHAATLGAFPEDVIVLTNADICFAPSFDRQINAAATNCCYAHRMEFPSLDTILSDQEIAKGIKYPGIDLFAFTSGWWSVHSDEFPDMVMGAEAWDLCLWELMKRHSESHEVIELENVIYHESHDSTWCRPENISTLPSQIHNLGLAREFLKGQPDQLALLIPNRPT